MTRQFEASIFLVLMAVSSHQWDLIIVDNMWMFDKSERLLKVRLKISNYL